MSLEHHYRAHPTSDSALVPTLDAELRLGLFLPAKAIVRAVQVVFIDFALDGLVLPLTLLVEPWSHQFAQDMHAQVRRRRGGHAQQTDDDEHSKLHDSRHLDEHNEWNGLQQEALVVPIR